MTKEAFNFNFKCDEMFRVASHAEARRVAAGEPVGKSYQTRPRQTTRLHHLSKPWFQGTGYWIGKEDSETGWDMTFDALKWFLV